MVLNSFKLILYLDTTTISDQIKYNLTINRRNFLEMQQGFYRCILCRLTMAWCWKSIYQELNKRLERDRLKHCCERSLNLCNWLSIHVSLFLLTGRAGIVNPQDCGMHLYLTSQLVRLSTITQRESCAISNLFESLQKFQGR